MKGWQIFTHSVRQVFGNLEGALRVSAVLYLAQILLGVGLMGQIMDLSMAERRALMQAGEFPMGRVLLSGVISIIASLWIAVAWHRYVLSEEKPRLVPPFHGARMLGYFGKGLLISLIAAVPFVLVSLLLSRIAAALVMVGSAGFALFFAAALFLPIFVILLRLSSILPGVALGAGQAIGAGWTATRGESGSIAVLGIAMIVGLGLLQWLGAFAFGGTQITSVIWNAILNWLVMMIGISVLTTLYGHYIEKRPLL